MNYAEIKKCDVANGPGVRVSLFVSGCTHHCKECFNKETWDFQFGKPFTQDTINEILELLSPDYIKGITLLGGESIFFLRKAVVPVLFPRKNRCLHQSQRKADQRKTPYEC